MSALLVLSTPTARADPPSEVACLGLRAGSSCLRGIRALGVCVPDASDPEVLSCKEAGSGDAGGGPQDGGATASGGSGNRPQSGASGAGSDSEPDSSCSASATAASSSLVTAGLLIATLVILGRIRQEGS